MEEKLQNIFREVFEDKNLVIYREMTADDVPAWDSLTYFELIMEVELAFGIKLTTAEISELETVGQLIDMVEEHTGEK